MSADLASRPPIAEPLAERRSSDPGPERLRWSTNLILFLLTVVSVFYVGRMWTAAASMSLLEGWLSAWRFAVPLLAILLAHEFGHYIAARLHRVPASLPYFLPLPVLNPFGTLGAVILMPRRIRSRKALLDIGAAGPLAGMAVAIPTMLYGLSLSTLMPSISPSQVGADDYLIQEGQSLLYWALKRIVFGPIPDGHDVLLHPTAFAAWVGFLITFINLLPYSQLDGGHVAYALLGVRQDRVARWFFYVPGVLVAYNFARYVWPVLALGFRDGFGTQTLKDYLPAGTVANWIFLWALLFFVGRFSGGRHPPVDDTAFSPLRSAVAVVTLALFVLLFMPTPLLSY